VTLDTAIKSLLRDHARRVQEDEQSGDAELAERLTRRRNVLSGWKGARHSERNQALWDVRRKAMVDAGEPIRDGY
jgi:hypothetical protein